MKYKVFFGHQNSVGVGVEATSEKEARVAAMDILRLNRQDTRWSSRQYINWEARIGDEVYTFDPKFPPEEAPMVLVNKDGVSVYAGPPTARDFGGFPPIVKVSVM